MGAAKPCLGYPSRTAAVHGLRAQGLTTRAIAAAIGIPDNTVLALECGDRRIRAIRPTEEMGRAVLFPVDVLAALGPHAARRGIHPNSLARLIVETAVDENMIDAILDDADELEGTFA